MYLAKRIPIIKKISTESEVPLPLPKKEPKYINKKIIEDEIILYWRPRKEPIIRNEIINSVLPKPIPKYEPTYAIYKEVNIMDILVERSLSKIWPLIDNKRFNAVNPGNLFTLRFGSKIIRHTIFVYKKFVSNYLRC